MLIEESGERSIIMIPGAISRFTAYYVNKEFGIMCKVCVYACVCAYMCACMHASMHVCVCVCVDD